jgi:dTMP kinase
MNTQSGFLISIEGIDGCGKSTLAKCLATTLNAKGFQTVLTKEPGGTSLGASLRSILNNRQAPVFGRAEFLLFAADRAQHFDEIVIPTLKDGNVVIADRLADSSLAYQGHGRGLDKNMIAAVNQWAMQNISPQLTIYLRITPSQAFNRIAQRNETLTAFEQEKISFWQRVVEGYEEIFSQRKNILTLDATMAPDDLCHLAMQEVLCRLM